VDAGRCLTCFFSLVLLGSQARQPRLPGVSTVGWRRQRHVRPDAPHRKRPERPGSNASNTGNNTLSPQKEERETLRPVVVNATEPVAWPFPTPTALAAARPVGKSGLYTYVYEGPARKHFQWWYGWAVRSRLGPMKEVAGMLKRRFTNIITYLKHRITNATSESINAKIQWVKYTARGFRNKQNGRAEEEQRQARHGTVQQTPPKIAWNRIWLAVFVRSKPST
jgi:Transposase